MQDNKQDNKKKVLTAEEIRKITIDELPKHVHSAIIAYSQPDGYFEVLRMGTPFDLIAPLFLELSDMSSEIRESIKGRQLINLLNAAIKNKSTEVKVIRLDTEEVSSETDKEPESKGDFQ